MPSRTSIALALLLALAAGVPAGTQPPRMKVVLDTDIGTDIDDAWALGYAVKSPAFELLGVTVTDADTPWRAKLACSTPMPLRVDRDGSTRVDAAGGHPVIVCLEPKRGEFMTHFLGQLAAR